MAVGRFRAGTGAVVFREDGKILAFARSNSKDKNNWQLPQGGLEITEKPIEGVMRELYEETALESKSVQLVAEYPDWIAYEFPEVFRLQLQSMGQVHRWFLFRFIGEESDIDPLNAPDDEFEDWRWMSINELCENTASFKAHVYRKLGDYFSDYLQP